LLHFFLVEIIVEVTRHEQVTHSRMTLPSVTVFLVIVTVASSQSIYEDCNVEDGKGCVGIPAECESNGSCNVIMTYKSNLLGDHYAVEVQGKISEDPSDYVDFGISRDEKMQDSICLL